MKANQSRQQLQTSINRLMDKLNDTNLFSRPVIKNIAHHQINRVKIEQMKYCIIDISDIQKPYSMTNAGLAKVRDGSKHQPVG